MKPERVLRRLVGILERCPELHSVGENIGNELPRDRLDVLRAFLRELSRMQGTSNSGFTDDQFVNGYVFALRDVIHAYTTEVGEAQDTDEAARHLLLHGFAPILAILATAPTTVADVAMSTEMSIDVIRPKMKLLQGSDLAETHHLDEGPYRLTSRGEKVWERMRSLDKGRVFP